MSIIITGFISGIISGMGMGGGTILILFLTIIYGIDQHVAQATNFMFFIPTSIISIITSIKNKTIDFKTGIYISIFGVIGAIIGSKISTSLDVMILRKCFGIFLLIITIFEISSIIKLYSFKKKTDNK